jgi:hypothetical protein
VTKKAAAVRAMTRLEASAANRQRRFKDLAKIDLTSTSPIEMQTQAWVPQLMAGSRDTRGWKCRSAA